MRVAAAPCARGTVCRATVSGSGRGQWASTRPLAVAASLHQTAGVRSFVVEHSRRPWSHRAGDLGWRGPHQDCPRQRSHHHGLRSRVRVRVRAQPPGEDGEPQAPPTADSPAPSADSSSSSSNGQDPASEHQPEETKKPSKLSVLALTMAATWAKTNASFLQFRKRKTWWKRGEYPKVPLDTFQDVHVPDQSALLRSKVLPLAVMFFCATFNLTILQNLKDALVITSGGAEMLPFLSTYVVLPMSIAFTAGYAKLCDSVHPARVFYVVVACLLACYLLFLAAFPFHQTLHLHGLSELVSSPALLGLVHCFENWTFSLFFGVSELWGTIVIALLSWGMANQVCNREEAKSVYPLMGIFANVAQVASGAYVKFLNNFASGSLHTSLKLLIGTVVGMSMVMMAAKRVLDGSAPVAVSAPTKKSKPKSSLGEGFNIIKESPRIRNLAMLVVGYGVAHRLFEFTWKGQLRVLYPSALEYQSILSSVSMATGVASIVMIGVASLVFHRFGWGVATALTPISMLVTGGVFFSLSIAGLMPGAASIATAGVMMGAVAQVMARSTKYSLFDAAKEMVYINMSKEEKSKGKAAVDVMGSQVGKSGAAFLTQAMLLLLGSITTALPFLFAAYVGICFTWLRSVFELQKDLDKENAEKEQETKSEVLFEGSDDDPRVSVSAQSM
mmetsp:Transcript_13251/g.25392  ORF Transcript_13251/g.25392 Transcript_13251/m.25392 type:complete len:672 (-) Transcript_13251:280-2295(-)